MSTKGRRIVYAGLAIVGIVATWYFNVVFTLQHGGFSVTTYLAECYANAASTSISNDILVALATFLFWSFFEARRLGMKHWWVYPASSILIAFAFAFPLFLWMRERRLAESTSVAADA